MKALLKVVHSRERSRTMISVVMPLYNKKAYVGEAIRSVLEQSFTNWELIVVNDGSTDTSEAIVLGFDDSRIRLVSQGNLGVSSARNRGVNEANFEWVAFLDADDFWESKFLETVVELIPNHPTKHLFATGRNHLFSNRKVRYSHPFLPNEGQTVILDYIEAIGRGGLPPINSSNVVIRRDLLKESGGFKEEMRAHEDHDLWLRLSADNDIVFINEALSNYRKRDNFKRRAFTATDFIIYLRTMQNVFSTISRERKHYLKQYSNRFILWSFWKNREGYSPVEKKGIIHYSKGLISLPSYWILWILYRF